MNRDEQIRLILVGNGGPRLQRDKGVIPSGVLHFRSQPRLEHLPQPPGDIEDQILLEQPVRPNRARVETAMAGIDHNLSDLQPQGADQGSVALRHGLSLTDAPG